jgi:hypothetical protein
MSLEACIPSQQIEATERNLNVDNIRPGTILFTACQAFW